MQTRPPHELNPSACSGPPESYCFILSRLFLGWEWEKTSLRDLETGRWVSRNRAWHKCPGDRFCFRCMGWFPVGWECRGPGRTEPCWTLAWWDSLSLAWWLLSNISQSGQHFSHWGSTWSVQDVFGGGCIPFGFHHLNLRAYDLDLSKVLFVFTCLI